VSPGLRAAVQGGVARIGDTETVRAASDHRPVAATLVFEDKK